MKILQVHENNKIVGGSEVYLKQLISALRKRDIETDWLAVTVSGEIYLNDKIQKISFDSIKDILDKDYDLVHIHGMSDVKVIEYFLDNYPVVRSMHEPRLICPGYGKFLVSSKKICDIKFGYHCLIKAYTERCQLSRKPLNVVKSLQRVNYEVDIASKKYKKIIAMSGFVKDEAVKSGIDYSKIAVIPYFTSFERQKNNFKGGQKRILFVGRLVATKGIIELITSLKGILKNNENVFLDIIGDGELKDEVNKLIESSNLQKKVVLHGWLGSQEVKDIMKKSYLLAFPSIYPEAFGIVGIEALSLSKPIVGFDVGGVSTWLKDGINGYLVANKDLNGFAEKVSLLISNNEKYYELSQGAFETSDEFSEEKHLKIMLGVYKTSINRNK
jgi:glycosyltransferase involved in cell wall biosynthesis